MLKPLALCEVVTREHDYRIISDIDENLQMPEMYLCANLGCLTLDGLERVWGQRNKHRDRDFMCKN